ncbi:MAG: undecaprenyl-diphosphate phosphatase [Verrucomicrobiota bacterium]
MESWQALLLGVIEGITEYLPISSTGHLVVTQRLLGIGMENSVGAKAAADCFAICIQGGAILAVLGLYLPRVLQMVRGVLGKDTEGLRLALAILISFLPAVVLGLKFNDWIEEKLFSLWPIIGAWVVGGVAILVAAWWRRRNPPKGGAKHLIEMTWKMAVFIGLMQCVAMWPGTSRSLMTIVGGILMGLTLQAAVEYSFLLGVLTLTAATAKKALWKVDGVDAYHHWCGGAHLMWDTYGLVPILVGVVAAAIAAALAVKWLVTYLQSHGLSIFGWYRIGLGMVVGGLIMAGWVAA